MLRQRKKEVPEGERIASLVKLSEKVSNRLGHAFEVPRTLNFMISTMTQLKQLQISTVLT